MYSFSDIKKSGLIHENGDFIVHPTYDKIITLKKVNNYFFGINETPITNPQFLLLSNIIIKYNNENYLILSKLNKYISAIGTMENQSNKFLTINYYNFIGKELNGIQKDIYDFNNNFINYLNIQQPLYFNTIIKMLGDIFFNGTLVGIEPITNIMSIKYDNIIITYGYNDNDMKLYINLNSNNFNIMNNLLYEQIKEAYLMMDIDRFVCYNLTKITNNEGFSSLLVASHNNKNEYCIPIYVINTFINFKNNKSAEKYLEKFKSYYQEDTIWINKEDEGIVVNFEGFNKYFLNLEIDDLINIKAKEIINDFYYNITNELINSYKTLFINKV